MSLINYAFSYTVIIICYKRDEVLHFIEFFVLEKEAVIMGNSKVQKDFHIFDNTNSSDKKIVYAFILHLQIKKSILQDQSHL